MSKKVMVRLINSKPSLSLPTVMINEALVKQWKLPASISLHFGTSKHTVNIVPAAGLEGIRINQAVSTQTGLSAGDQVRMQYHAHSQTLQVGPLIGVLLGKIGSGSSLFGNMAAFSKELSDAGRLYGACVIFFTPKDIMLDREAVQAWVYRSGWRKTTFPLPDVVYNRLTTRKIENSHTVQRFIKEMKNQYQAKVFNERFLNKTEVFELLKKDGEVRKLLPESHTLKNYAMFQTMCSRYAIVYLKPTKGSLGRGIVRVKRGADGGVVCQHAMLNGVKTIRHSSLRKCYSSISGKLKSARYQIQQGIDLITVQGRPVDFRALVQRNQQGQWSITSIVARTAGIQHFVSNVARGGSLSPVKTALLKSNLSAQRRSSAHRALRHAALNIAEALQRQIPEHFAELGIDLAVSSSGRVWLIEVNSKPSKGDNTPLTNKKIRPSAKQTIQYARFLTEL